MRIAGVVLAVLMGLSSASSAKENPLFQGKTISLLVGSSVGGGTDNTARMLAAAMSKQLGVPIVIRNMPGANGVTAMNYFAERAASDPFTIILGANSQADPATYRKPAARYDPVKAQVIGGLAPGGQVLIVNKEALGRLADKNASPLTIGSVGALPRSGMLSAAWAIEFLNWNGRWVMGYPGTNDLLIALERGEVDMTSTGNFPQLKKLMDTGRFAIVMQTGTLHNGKFRPRDDFKTVPVISDKLDLRLKDQVALKAFRYWSTLTTIEKWVALGPDVPPAYLAAYRAAFKAALEDPELKQKAADLGDELLSVAPEDFQNLLKVVGDTPPEAIEFIAGMVQRQSGKQ